MIKSSLSASKYTFLLSVILAASINNVMADNSTKVFSLQSNLADNSSFPPEYFWNQFGCSGNNIAPSLTWQNAPAGTKSFAVTFYDKDAPTGSGFWHRVVYDISAKASTLAGGVNGGALPSGAIEANTDLGKPGFFGPCPPEGREHSYVWTVHALDVAQLPIDKGSTPALVGFYLWQHRLGEASLTLLAGPR
ncbi:YbhB/YbcL family Raf kinase inhibitor-like protein [Shewanella sp. SP2S2-4]|uniref:YbhB/YbcL family Raf kinase inhibitor-like protein n=1 Tax=Shewanella TaxID=22 RepID=UPI00288CC6C0|nr:YbhB/YbcL family Raf kinase inhibitor-like protein [Shewanella sp. SP2S2-4]MDT3275366.1 YbhB/YbcL family Raf kinase inhibitor-like protein [Shewanella sp. SP2S2-4]